MRKEKALWIFGEEVGERGVIDWLKAHTSFLKPLHRYEGEIGIEDEKLKLDGRNTKSDEDFSLEIPRKKVLYVNHGYDEVFKRGEERSLGLGLKPLLIEYEDNKEEKKLYLFVNFSRFPRTSDNSEWFNYLIDWIDKE